MASQFGCLHESKQAQYVDAARVHYLRARAEVPLKRVLSISSATDVVGVGFNSKPVNPYRSANVVRADSIAVTCRRAQSQSARTGSFRDAPRVVRP